MNKKIFFIVGLWLSFTASAQENGKKLLNDLSFSLSLTKKDPAKGLQACLAALNRMNQTSPPASASLAQQFEVLHTSFAFIQESGTYDEVVEQLFEHFEACKKIEPMVALQFMTIVDALTQGELSSYDKWRLKFREFLFANGWLMLYHYYGMGYYDMETGWDTDCSYVLFSDYDWAEEGDFIKSDNEKLSITELSLPLAEYISNSHANIVDGISKDRPYAYFTELKSWSHEDVLALWYNMLEAYESGQLYKALMYGKLAQTANVKGKAREYQQELLQDYEMVKGSVFDPRVRMDSVSVKTKLNRTRLWKMFEDVTTVAKKRDEGKLTLEDINRSKKKVESYVEKFNAKKYIEFGVYQYDLSYAELYKNYGAVAEAKVHLERLKQVDTLSFLQWQKHQLTLGDYADFHLQMAVLCYGIDNFWHEKECREVEKTLRLLTGIVPVEKFKMDGDPRNKIDWDKLKENAFLINEFTGTLDQNRKKAILDRIQSFKQKDFEQFTEVSVLLPNQWVTPLYVRNFTFFTWLTDTYEQPEGTFVKYASCGYPMVYGMTNLTLFSYLSDYHDLLEETNHLYDFEPWYNVAFNLYEHISYTRPLCIDQFRIDFDVIDWYDEKGYDNKVESILAKWRNHTRHFNDTLSHVYAYTLAAETQYLGHKLPAQQKIDNARKYFEIVKIKGDCSQCYITSAFTLADNYLEAGDTVRSEIIVKELVHKVNTEKSIPNDLQSSIWNRKGAILLARIQSRYANNQPYEDLLNQLEKIMTLAMPLDKSRENAFFSGQIWIEMERKNYTHLAAADRVWKFFHDEHQRYSKNSWLYTDKDRQEYFNGLQEYLNLVTWRYHLIPNDNEDLAKDIFSYTAHYKSFATGSFPAMKKYIQAKNDTALTAKWNEWVQMRSNTGKRKAGDDLKEYKLEKEFLAQMQRDSVLSIENPVSFDELKKKLDDKSYLINIVTSSNAITGEKIYFAQVVNQKSSQPQYVFLGKAALLEQKGYTAYEKAMKTLSTANADTTAYAYFWKPLEKIIPTKSKVYILNDGVYHKINLGSVYHAGRYLCDQWDFQVIVKLDEVGKTSGEMGKIKADIFGNPRFNLSYSKSGMTISHLQNTQQECETIEQILGKETSASIHRYTAEKANEDQLKEIVQPTVLHIATHGFFVPDQKEDQDQTTFEGEVAFRSTTTDFASATDPLLRSGILLSGAENTLNGKNLSLIGKYHEDGILTAKEAMELNLDSTQLVVLSACETGLGEIIPGQSIAGLQNGFKTAGARYLLLTLWSVDDQATKDFMVMFYGELVKHKNKVNAVEESFFSAQRQFKQLPQYSQPFFWGAFVLVK